MRIYFRKLDRAKKAAKALAAAISGVKLPTAQETVAKLTGYRDRNDLTKNHQKKSIGPATAQSEDEWKDRAISSTQSISKELCLGFGDSLFALTQMNLPGIQVVGADTYEALWLHLFKETR